MAYAPASDQIVAQANAKYLESLGNIAWWGQGGGPGSILAEGHCWTWHDWGFYVGNAGIPVDYLRLPIWSDVQSWYVPAVSPSLQAGTTYDTNTECHQLVRWNLNVVDVAVWHVEGIYGAHPVQTVSGGTDNVTFDGLSEDTSYSFDLYGYKTRTREGQTEQLNTATVRKDITTGLLTPSSVTASYNSSTGVVTLTFTNNSLAATHLQIYRNNGVLDEISSTGTAGVRTYQDTTGTIGGQTYTYWVYAIKRDAGGAEVNTSMESAHASVTLPSTSPTHLQANYQGAGSGTTILSWDASIDTSTWQYRLQRSETDGFGNPIAWDEVTTTTNTSYFDSGLTIGRGYVWQIRAERQDGSQFLSYTRSNAITAS